MADEAVRIDDPGGDAAKKLDFLAPHNVGATLTDVGDARHDGLAVPRPDERVDKLLNAYRAGNIRRFDPAAIGTDHPRQQ
jgi:hypothetical protein